jgi:hypothetical protein
MGKRNRGNLDGEVKRKNVETDQKMMGGEKAVPILINFLKRVVHLSYVNLSQNYHFERLLEFSCF